MSAMLPIAIRLLQRRDWSLNARGGHGAFNLIHRNVGYLPLGLIFVVSPKVIKE